jgi:large conductance mechanosensitive channel
MTIVSDFFSFLKTFGIVGLAIAFIIGNASSAMVSSLVDDVVNPTVGLFLPSGNLNNATVTIHSFFFKSGGGQSTFKIGHLVSEIINFIIIAFLVFLAYRELKKFDIVKR